MCRNGRTFIDGTRKSFNLAFSDGEYLMASPTTCHFFGASIVGESPKSSLQLALRLRSSKLKLLKASAMIQWFHTIFSLHGVYGICIIKSAHQLLNSLMILKFGFSPFYIIFIYFYYFYVCEAVCFFFEEVYELFGSFWGRVVQFYIWRIFGESLEVGALKEFSMEINYLSYFLATRAYFMVLY